jgi:hypothetical protein
MNDAALEALASRGLVRRALADAAAGKAELRREEEDAAEVAVDGETVHLVADGIARSRCTCPAPGICRHRLAAIIHLRSAAPADATTIDWKSVFESLTPAAIARFAGKAGWRDVLSRELAPASVEDRGNSFAVKASQHAVIFLPEGGLATAITKAPPSARKVAIAAAALAARQSLGLPPPEDIETVPPSSDSKGIGAAGLAEIRRYLERAWMSGFALAPVALENEARRLALSSRVEAAPRLTGLLRRISSGIAELRLRSADSDPETLLMLLAEAYALCIALEREPEEPLLGKLRGVIRQEYADIGDVELFGLGARLWATPSGAHGVTAHFFAPADGRTYSLSLARADHTDVQFDPRTAFQHSGIWGAPISRLCIARLELQSAQASVGGRLSTSSATRAKINPWLPARDEIREWPSAFDDWSRLESHLQARFMLTLAAEAVRDVPVILVFARHASARFDEITQTLSWPIADSAGRWLGLTLDYEGREKDRIAALEEMVRRERFWAVVATAALEQDRIALRPYALWSSTQHLLDFAREKVRRDGASMLELLRRLRLGGLSGPSTFFAQAPATNAVLTRAWNELLSRAEGGEIGQGLRHAEEISKKLERAGFAWMAQGYRGLGENADAAGCLRAAYAVAATRRARASIAWMR